jgi:hypothetical protein
LVSGVKATSVGYNCRTASYAYALAYGIATLMLATLETAIAAGKNTLIGGRAPARPRP